MIKPKIKEGWLEKSFEKRISLKDNIEWDNKENTKKYNSFDRRYKVY